MDASIEPFWNLDQVCGWIETRDLGVVRFAAWPAGASRAPSTSEIAVRSLPRATQTRRLGRDIDNELWALAGQTAPSRHYVPPGNVARYLNDTNLSLKAILDKNLVVQAPSDGGEERLIRREPFPTIEFLTHLFRDGRLVAIGNVPGASRPTTLSVEDWSGLEIQVGGTDQRLGVWRIGQARSGAGAFENVRVRRDPVMKLCPAGPSPASVKVSDDDIRSLFSQYLGELGDRPTQSAAVQIVRDKWPSIPRDRVREVYNSLFPNRKPGPRGPRKNRAK